VFGKAEDRDMFYQQIFGNVTKKAAMASYEQFSQHLKGDKDI